MSCPCESTGQCRNKKPGSLWERTSRSFRYFDGVDHFRVQDVTVLPASPRNTCIPVKMKYGTLSERGGG